MPVKDNQQNLPNTPLSTNPKGQTDYPTFIPHQEVSQNDKETTLDPQNSQNTMAENLGTPPSPPSNPPGTSDPQDFVISPHNPRKNSGKKIIATIFGVLILIGGISAGVLLVQRNQEIRERAAIPTPPSSARCIGVRAYDTNWNLLTQEDLSRLRPGDKVYFAVSGTATSGTFDKARFTINGVQRKEVTTRTPNSALEFYDEYIIPQGIPGTNNFTVKGEIHHTELGWI